MNNVCSIYFERTLEEARKAIEPLATKCLDNLQGFIDGLYLTRQIDHEEEEILRKKVMEVRLNRDIMFTDENLKRHIDDALGKVNP